MYVTLEPCSHYGHTPPCADALVTAGVARVVAGMQDPNPEVAGRGMQRLAQAGIEVLSGVLESQARALNPGFLKRMEHGLPFVRVKLAMSLDGRTAMASGEPVDHRPCRPRRRAAPAGRGERGADRRRYRAGRWCAPDRARRRAGPGSANHRFGDVAPTAARADRWPPAGAAQRPVLQGRPGAGHHLRDPGKPVPRGPECLVVPGVDGQVDLRSALVALAARGVNEVLVEAGPSLAGAFAQQGLVDEYVIFVAGKFLGSAARPLLDWPLEKLADAPNSRSLKCAL